MISKLSVVLPSYPSTAKTLRDMSRQAEEAGFEAAWGYQICRDPFTTLAAAASVTERIKLGTAVALAFTRSTFVTANAAADVDELSDGRMILGLGTGEGQHLVSLHNSHWNQAVPRMREYVSILRLAWESLGTGKPVEFRGDHYQLVMNEGLRRPLARPQIPIYLAAMGPKMIELAGEVGDGIQAFFHSAKYLREVTIPRLETGAKRAGRDPASVAFSSYVITSVSNDREEALRRARIMVGFYTAFPSSDPIIAHHGLQQEQAAVRQALYTQGPAALEKATDAKLVEAFSIAGTPDECRRQLAAYTDILDLALLQTPYFDPLTTEECEDAFNNVLDTFGS